MQKSAEAAFEPRGEAPFQEAERSVAWCTGCLCLNRFGCGRGNVAPSRRALKVHPTDDGQQYVVQGQEMDPGIISEGIAVTNHISVN